MTEPALLHRLPGVSSALSLLLRELPGPVQPPVRSEIFGPQRFAQHGRSLAQTHRAASRTLRHASFFPRLRNNILALRQAHTYIGAQAATGYDISPAAEWLLDNFHLIEAQLQEVHQGLPRRYFQSLPLLVDEPLAGLPRIYGVAWAFVAHTDSAFDEHLILHFLDAYQEVRELSLSEIWALPTTLRVVLIENLRRLAERVATNKAAREIANLCCDDLARLEVQDLEALLVWLTRRGVHRVFLVQLAQRLQDLSSTLSPGPIEEVRAWLGRALPDLASLLAQQNADQAADNLSVSNAVKSLRAIGHADWTELVASTSALMRRMLTSPEFVAEHPDTRQVTLHGIERLARRRGRSEIVVADRLLGLMRSATGELLPDRQPGHWLNGPGRPELLAALGLKELVVDRLSVVATRLALPVYLMALLAGAMALVGWMLHSAGAAGSTSLSQGVLWVTGLLLLMPASETVVAMVNRITSELVRPAHLPRLEFFDGIPEAHRVLVVIPALLGAPHSNERLVHRLLLHYLANPEPRAQFALLTDWGDANVESLPADAPALEAVCLAIRQINRQYPCDREPRFIVLHRARQFSETEQCWMGWERKRGKLEQLVEAMAGNPKSAFVDLGPDSQLAPATPYIVTLDSDTQLPPGRLRALVSVAAHPANQPRLDPTRRFVQQGYGILQPRVVTPLPARSEFTLFHWLFAGQCGIDPYSAPTSEVYQDLFGEGTFTGKGLLHVAALHTVLSGRLPSGQILSHDLLEGAIARCAAVSDLTVIEDAPFHADVAAARVHRWTRGDWQLLPILMQPRRYGLGAIHCWKMFDNLRRSLVAPASMVLLVVTLAGGVAVAPAAALLLVFAALGAGPLMGAAAGFLPSRFDIAMRHFYLQATVGMGRAMAGSLWLFAQLLAQSLRALDAVLRATYRTFASRRNLLQWTTAAAVQAQTSSRLGTMLARHWMEPVAALGLLVGVLALKPGFAGLTVALLALWGGAPLWAWWVSRPRANQGPAMPSPADARLLHAIAFESWQLFERCVTADDNHLPPDNLQISPHEMLAHRTSPTNIGLYLLSTACACEFGWITRQQLIVRLQATLGTLDHMERYRGHFFNWYDTQTCAPLAPRYVSTVDSGNLSGHMLATAQACLEMADKARRVDDHPSAMELQVLADRLEQMAWQPEFAFLYHPKRHLFHIGYRWPDQQVDPGFYDLLASESRSTSLLAIAKGDVPPDHWAALGRPAYALRARAGLRSWSGSMFEYLMPGLTLDEPEGSVLSDACMVALAEQWAFAKVQKVPWGISESAYAGRDHSLAYQYAPQGVPRLALRRTPPEQLVVAPYATALAAPMDPAAACRNFVALEALGARGAYGFIEALDFSPGQRSGSTAATPVCTFMAHHHGMTIAALANVLLERPVQRWGMATARIQAVASLLHEKAPREVSLLNEPPAGRAQQALKQRAPGLLREVVPGASALEPTHVMSNGRYSVALRANGAGWSRWGHVGLTRWRDDALRDSFGSFFYLREPGKAVSASLTQHPAPDPSAYYLSTYHADRVCFDAVWPDKKARTTVWVSPEDDIEFRQVEIHNLGHETMEIELLSVFDVTLTDFRADEAHPAFTSLFVHAEWLSRHRALSFWRTPRLDSEPGVHATHFLAQSDASVQGIDVQTSRQCWLGRNRDVSQPLGQVMRVEHGESDEPLVLETGLDPVCVLAVRLRIEPQGSASLVFATAAAADRRTLTAVTDKYCQPTHIERSSLMSATLAGIRLRGLRISAENFAATQVLTTALVLTVTRPQFPPASLDGGPAPSCDRKTLWRFGISGERPIILVSAGLIQGLGLLRSLAQSLRLWAWCSVSCDVVVLNSEPNSYQMELQRELAALRERHLEGNEVKGAAATTSLHVLRADELSAAELATLQRLARVRLNADGRPLQHHVQEWAELHEQAFWVRTETSTTAVPVTPGSVGLRTAVPAPQGTFHTATGEFHFDAGARLRPTRPWINVLANPQFGAQISEAGGGYTWAGNSRMNQLTAWSNDPVADPPSEGFLLQDTRSREVWSLTPSAWGDSHVTYRIVHGQGFTTVNHWHDELEVTARWCVDGVSAIKQIQVEMVNHGHRTLHLRLVGLAEWMMGSRREDRATVATALCYERGPAGGTQLVALTATQQDQSGGFGQGTAFLAMTTPLVEDPDWTCDRREFFDARGRLVLPDHFGQRAGDGLDPCAALSARLVLRAGESGTRTFLMGYAADPVAARRLATDAAAEMPARRLDLAVAAWDSLLGASEVATPDPLFDVMVNRWLVYQTVACRIWAKAGFYQAGGATGFRDQLQDTMGLAWAAPVLLRVQIVACASRQFPQGDVQHWWHLPGGAGVRTHFSDDLLWLACACVRYVQATGDLGVLDEMVPFIEGMEVPAGAEDAYYTPEPSKTSATVYEHAALALDRSLATGANGLPLMGSGDWNDGMNRVGYQGRGESVWLGWFLCDLVAGFAPIARSRADTQRAVRWETAALGWQASLNENAWDGNWFVRAFFDNGRPLGTHTNSEARIDLMAQSWAVLSGATTLQRQQQAMRSVSALLADASTGLLRLLDPPLKHSRPDAGYIQAYPPGVRENGGQYSHAAVWALMAQARLAVLAAPAGSAANGDLAWRTFTWISPAHRAAHPTQGARYGIEPYVVAGDVYSQPPYAGQGGWSWYTGAAAWLHRAALESILGLTQCADRLRFTPCLPEHWPSAALTLRRGGLAMHFTMVRCDGAAATALPQMHGATVLAPGQWLDWRQLDGEVRFVIPLLEPEPSARG
jgi:cyclic beta-1,2-glucan synthetase